MLKPCEVLHIFNGKIYSYSYKLERIKLFLKQRLAKRASEIFPQTKLEISEAIYTK